MHAGLVLFCLTLHFSFYPWLASVATAVGLVALGLYIGDGCSVCMRRSRAKTLAEHEAALNAERRCVACKEPFE